MQPAAAAGEMRLDAPPDVARDVFRGRNDAVERRHFVVQEAVVERLDYLAVQHVLHLFEVEYHTGDGVGLALQADLVYMLTPDGNTLSLIASGDLFSEGPDAVVVVYVPPAPPLPTLSLTTSSLPNGTVGAPYGPVVMSATGGSGNYSWSVYGAPPGVTMSLGGTLSSSGNLSAAAAGSYSVIVTLFDSLAGQVIQRQFPVICSPAVSITTSSLPNGAAGLIYGPVTLAASGGSGNYSWTVSGAPPGVTVTPAGVLGSAAPLAAPRRAFPVITTATDTTTNATGSRTFSVTIFSALSVTTSALPDGTVGLVYGPVTLAATGGSGTTPGRSAARRRALP